MLWPTDRVLTHLAFNVIGQSHHLDGVVDAESFNRRPDGQSFQSAFSTLNVAVADEPPRRFGRKKCDYEQGDGPNPLESSQLSYMLTTGRRTHLDGKRNTPPPLVGSVQKSPHDAC